MLSLISFLLVIIGAINWFCIGLLQFDFVAGLFGSQSSIFSRIVYIAVGLSALILLYNLMENRGKIKFNMNKLNAESVRETFAPNKENTITATTEAGSDLHIDNKNDDNSIKNTSCSHNNNSACNKASMESRHNNEMEYQDKIDEEEFE